MGVKVLKEQIGQIGQIGPQGAGAKELGGENTGGQPPGRTFFRWRPFLLPLLGGLLVIVLLFTGGTKALMAYTDRPAFCLSCHVMEQPYDSWFHSSHREWATCTDCHVPHQNLAAKLTGKARDGMQHLYVFYTNPDPDPIRLYPRNSRTVKQNCLRCHGSLMENIDTESRNCWDCHRSVPHGSL